MKYLRIGTDYYKIVKRPTINGGLNPSILTWKRHTIVDDHGKDFLKEIPKYEGFTVFPSHTNYKIEINKFYNKYRPLTHDLSIVSVPSQFKSTLQFLTHIFGDQLDLALDYLSILWKYPTQILPILCLVSDERNTGKTTFLNWLKLIFEDNMTINKNEDFRSRFNSDWSEKLIIAIDEVLLDKKEDSERIKNLSTASLYKTEAKGKDKVESHFFGKFVLCSNNEENFILIDEKEIRYWVIKVPIIKDSNPELMEVLIKELPYFVNYISNRNITSPKKTRMWFTSNQIYTEALNKLVKGTKYYLEKELILIIKELLDDFEIASIPLTFKDIQDLFKDSNHRVTRRELNRIIIDKWELKSQNSSYLNYYKSIDPITNEWQVNSNTKKGRFFVFENEFIKNL